MTKQKTLFSALLLGMICVSCNNRVYNNKSFLLQNSIKNKTVAILPIQIKLTGKIPKEITAQQISLEEESQGKVYQELLYSEFLDKSKAERKNKFGINFISTLEVNNKLQKAGVDYKSLQQRTAKELAAILGVDMILQVKIHKQRLMSNYAALGFDIAREVLNEVGRLNTLGLPTNTHHLIYDATLFDGLIGTTICELSNLKYVSYREDNEHILRRNFARTTRKMAIFSIN